MKEYFVSFSLMFFASLASCLWMLASHVSMLIPALAGGVVLAAIAYWRLQVVRRDGLHEGWHTVALALGPTALYAPMIYVTAAYPSIATVCSWILCIVLTGIAHRMKKHAYYYALTAIWVIAVIAATPWWMEVTQ